eukprot:5759109-Prymnesium_polylepis.1
MAEKRNNCDVRLNIRPKQHNASRRCVTRESPKLGLIVQRSVRVVPEAPQDRIATEYRLSAH